MTLGAAVLDMLVLAAHSKLRTGELTVGMLTLRPEVLPLCFYSSLPLAPDGPSYQQILTSYYRSDTQMAHLPHIWK